mmetsp:Transcript_30869/g.55952  ORF Transcript_30869/g.55952 Transcript_30869/m.55952 type:complete len:82 (-) Transcript_30869:581-826(-)
MRGGHCIRADLRDIRGGNKRLRLQSSSTPRFVDVKLFTTGNKENANQTSMNSSEAHRHHPISTNRASFYQNFHNACNDLDW